MTYPLFSDEPHPAEEILSEGEDDFEEDDEDDYYPDGPDPITVR
jgi:hypothetical protein